MMYRCFVAAIVSMAASFVGAQVEVVDRRVAPDTITSFNQAPSNATVEMYHQLQVLQQEVQQLRGLVEQQAFEIKKLKQQRLDDYLDLDRRLGQISQGSTNTVSPTGSLNSSSQPVMTSSQDELKSYRAAMGLVLKEQKYDQAIASLEKHLEDFPRGRYSANAQYWLGEVHLQTKELEQARQWFTRVINEYSDHSKVPDAQFKLGVVYDLLGDKAAAKKWLETVAQSDANAARLAREYLEANFSQ